jgi:hypothetical protein
LRILSGENRLAEWWETASGDECSAASDALLSLNDGTWRLHYPYYQEVTMEDAWVLILRPGLTLTIRFDEEADGFQLIHIGRDDF